MDTGQSKHRLLLVDGDPKSLRVLEVSLKKAGFDVATATQANDALGALQSTLPDLIISDTDLDGRDGFDLCRQIKAKPEWAKIPFLFVSGRKSIEDKIRGLELGVDDYLTKPIYIKEIGIRVRTALQRAERERLESRREGRTKFAGDLSDIGVVDLVQTIDLNRKSGIIHIVNRDGRRGAVFFREGKVIDAEVGRLAGAEAMYRLFSWSDGRFEVEFKAIRRHDVIDLPSAALLMEGMRRLDEWTRLLEKLPGLDSAIEVDFRMLGEQLADLPDEMNGILRLCDGTRSLLAVIDDSDFPDLEALTMASRLFEQGIIYTRDLPGSRPNAEPGSELQRWLAETKAEDGAPPKDASALRATATEFPPPDPEASKPTPSPDEMRASGERQGGTTLKTFSLDITMPSLDAPPHTRAERTEPPRVSVALTDQSVARAQPKREQTPLPTDKRVAAASSSAATPAVVKHFKHEPNLPTGLSPSPVPAAPAPIAKGAADGSAVKAKPDTLRGIPIPEEIADVEQPGPIRQAPARDDVRSGHTTLELVSSVGPVAPGAGLAPTAPPASVSAADKARETDWGGWAEGSESKPVAESEAVQSPRAQVNEKTPESAPSSPPHPAAGASTDGARVSGEAYLQGDDTSAMDEGAVAPESFTKTQIIPRSARLEKLGGDLLPHERRWPLFLIAAALFVATGLFAIRIRPTGTRSATPSNPESASAAPMLVATGGVAQPADQMAGSRAVTADAQAQPTAAAQEPGTQPSAASGKTASGPAAAGQTQSPALASAPPGSEGLAERCRKVDAGGKGRPTAILAACRSAIEAEPTAADIMVILARLELDRGRAAEARSWAKKAIEINPNLADAYVFLGGAEQEVGTPDAAKAAYKRYLELAPNGRHARELRTVLNSM
jgi:CheY-like chemotaxis protein/Flp pilus assembly protein TadD